MADNWTTTINTGVPNPARIYDYLLGGKDNFPADRDVAEQLLAIAPVARDVVEDNRAFLRRAVRFLTSEAGIRQFIDLGSGLPTQGNVHEVAQADAADARVVYVDNDPMVLSHGRALLADNRNTTVVTADLRDPAGILANPEVREHLDFDRPIAVVIVGMIMQISEDEEPDEIIAALMEPLASGSHLFLTAWPDTGDPAQHGLSRACLETLGNGWIRPIDRLQRHFQGLPMVAPGLEFVSRWYPGEPDRKVPDFADFEPYERTQMAGIAVKP